MKRCGFFTAEALAALLVIAAMCAAAFPMLGRVADMLERIDGGLRNAEDGFFAYGYMTDKLRHSLQRTESAERTEADEYKYKAYDESDVIRLYTLLMERRAWKVKLYNGRKQPITGDDAAVPQYGAYRFGSTAASLTTGEKYFTTEPGGLVRVSYVMRRLTPLAECEVRTAVLPLYDYFLVGEAYE